MSNCFDTTSILSSIHSIRIIKHSRENLTVKENKSLYRLIDRNQTNLDNSLNLFGIYLRVIFPGTRFYWSRKEWSCDGGSPGRESISVTSNEFRNVYKLLKFYKDVLQLNTLTIQLEKYLNEPLNLLFEDSYNSYGERRINKHGFCSRLFLVLDYPWRGTVFNHCLHFFDLRNRIRVVNEILNEIDITIQSKFKEEGQNEKKEISY